MSHCFVNHAEGTGRRIYHARGPFYLNETAVLAGAAAGGRFGLLYNHGMRHAWLSRAVNPPARFFTVVRDPVKRALSVLSHGRTPSFAAQHKGVFCNQFPTVDEAIAKCADLKNFQAFYVGPKSGSGKHLCSTAACTMSSYAFVMPMERIDECRVLLVLDHGFTPAEAVCSTRDQHHDGKPAGVTLSATQLGALEANNQHDIALYRAAVGALDARKRELGGVFESAAAVMATLLNATSVECPLGQSSKDFEARLAKFRRQFACFRARAEMMEPLASASLPPAVVWRRTGAGQR